DRRVAARQGEDETHGEEERDVLDVVLVGTAYPFDQFIGRAGAPSAEAVVLRTDVSAADSSQHADERDHEEELECQYRRADREDVECRVRELDGHQRNIARARSRGSGLIRQTRNLPSRSAVISSAFTSSFTLCETVGEPILSERRERTTSESCHPSR